MADYTYASEIFFNELLRISSDVVWKNPQKAYLCEAEVSDKIPYIEQYVLSRQGRLVFDLVEEFAEDVIISIGITDREEVISCVDDKMNIPKNLRNLAVQRQMEWVINNYDEPNNYYRMLNGLPDTSDTEEDWVYNTEYPNISNPDIPLHELNRSQLYQLDAVGYIQKVIDEHPTKKYLRHLLDRKIDIYTARQSNSFALLWIKDSEYETLVRDFIDTYEECRYMVSTVFYQKVIESSNEKYVGFVGMLILWQTILQMHRKFLDADITRDFYDEDSIRLVYDSYDVPFYMNIPMEYHKKIVKNINILLSHKGSTRVFYDIFDLFGLDDTAVFEFYLMKIHKFKDGKPVFYFNEDGTPNIQEMYDVRFGKVKLYDDPTTEMNEPKNQTRYDDMTRNDPYWINDKDLIEKIYSREFNYMDSKYLGIQTTFNLMQIIYETCYYIKLILDNKEALKSTAVYNNYTHNYTNFFDLVVYISALITKKFGFSGNIPTDIHSIGKVMGFNFQEDLITLKQNISESDYLKNDSKLLTLLETMDVYSLESVKRVYNNLTELRKYLVQKMADTDNVPTYMAYYELYQTIMYSKYVSNTFKKSDGTMAISFSDMLQDINYSMYSKWESLDEEDELQEEITNNLYLLKSSCSSLSRIQYADTTTVNTIMEYLFKLLEFFKSAKADLTGYEIVFSLVSSGENVMKLMNYISLIKDTYVTPQYSYYALLAEMHLIRDLQRLSSHYKYIAEMHLEFHSSVIDDKIKFIDDMIRVAREEIGLLVSTEHFVEDISEQEIILLNPDVMTTKDQLLTLYEELTEAIRFYLNENHCLYDEIIRIKEKLPTNLSLTEKMRIVSKIAVAVFLEEKRSSTIALRDSSREEFISFMECDELFFNQLLRIYKEKNHVELELVSEDILDLYRNMENGYLDQEKLGDKLKYWRFIGLISDIENNHITYMESIVGSSLFSILEERDFPMKDYVMLNESYDYIWNSRTSYEGFIINNDENAKILDGMPLSDSIILRMEEKIED